MNANSESPAVAGKITTRRQPAPKKPRKTRSKFAYLFDLTDEKEARMCHCMSIYHLGTSYQAVKFKRTYRTVGDKRHRAIFEVVHMPRRAKGKRWCVVGWDVEKPEIVYMDVPTKAFALAMLREFPAR